MKKKKQGRLANKIIIMMEKKRLKSKMRIKRKVNFMWTSKFQPRAEGE